MTRKATICILPFLLLVASTGLFAGPSSLKCLSCHSAPGFSATVQGKNISLHVSADQLAGSVHASRECVDCHADLQGQSFPHNPNVEPVKCARCHYGGNTKGAPVAFHVDKFSDSVHGNAIKNGDQDAPRCQTCHGTHGIKPISDPSSPVYRSNIPSMCGQCHFNKDFAKRHGIKNVSRYKDSVHAKAVKGNASMLAAVCIDCHGVHDIKAPANPGSSVNRQTVPETCGKCHKDIFALYKKGIHGQAWARGVKDAPVCTDCHGEHGIQPPSASESSVYPTHVVTTCSKCHESVKLQRRYGLPGNRMSTYLGSYHGVAGRFGNYSVANCATCHGAHEILPSSDPNSAINKNNLPKTCGKCHGKLSDKIMMGDVHVVVSSKRSLALYYISTAFKWLTLGTMLALIGHIILDLWAKLRARRRRRGNGR